MGRDKVLGSRESLKECVVLRSGLSAGANPARQLLLEPYNIGAAAEVTKRPVEAAWDTGNAVH
jgi:hypothetical protein